MSSSSSNTVYVAMGSNLGDREGHIVQACADISALAEVSNVECSSLYETDPMGPQDQPDYLNAVCRFSYMGTAEQLLEHLQLIERQHGRVKTTKRWTARPLDLDIALFGEHVIDKPHLRIPHIGIAERSFVLWPLLELDPTLQVPELGSAKALAEHCQQFGIKAYTRSVK